jgi:membrane-associated phospholipid phosphatase
MISTGTSANVIHDGVGSHRRFLGAAADPRSVALGCLAIYLTASGIVLLVGGHFLLALIHAAGIALAVGAFNPRDGVAAMTGDFLPLVAFPLLYSEIPQLIAALGTTYHDQLVQAWEIHTFGTLASGALGGSFPFLPLSELLHAGYLAYYLVIFVPPLLLYAKGERRGFEQTVVAVAITYALCWTIFALFPVQGPRYLFASPDNVPNGPVRRLALWILASGSSRGAAFPSSHMAICVVQTLMALRWRRSVALILAPITALVGVGAVYGGFHYGVDMLAGAGLGFIVATVVLRVFRRAVAGR